MSTQAALLSLSSTLSTLCREPDPGTVLGLPHSKDPACTPTFSHLGSTQLALIPKGTGSVPSLLLLLSWCQGHGVPQL